MSLYSQYNQRLLGRRDQCDYKTNKQFYRPAISNQGAVPAHPPLDGGGGRRPSFTTRLLVSHRSERYRNLLTTGFYHITSEGEGDGEW